VNVHRTVEASPRDQFFCSVKAVIITYSECMSVALVIQDAMRMCRIILLYVACLTVQYFSTLSHKRHDLRGRGGIIELKMCVVIFCTTFVWKFSRSKRN